MDVLVPREAKMPGAAEPRAPTRCLYAYEISAGARNRYLTACTLTLSPPAPSITLQPYGRL